MKKIAILSFVGIILLVAGSVFYLFHGGRISFNNPSRQSFPVRGVDVSEAQGEIDWDVLASQDLRFAYIKATEGSSYRDPMLEKNMAGAAQTDLKYGFYHFFSYDSPGKAQAENYIQSVPKIEGMMPPAVDIEFYGQYKNARKHPQDVWPNLDALLDRLRTHYGATPVLYATRETYDYYLADRYPDYPLWIRDVYSYPSLPNGVGWIFWQYSDRQALDGYSGPERFIDMNVFNGGEKKFEQFLAAKRTNASGQRAFEDAWAEFEDAWAEFERLNPQDE